MKDVCAVLDRKWLIHCCKDKTITYRTRDQPIFNRVALPVYSVDTEKEAEALTILCCRRQYEEHPLIPGKPWYRITLDGELDFKQHLDYEDIPAVTAKLHDRYQQIKEGLDLRLKLRDKVGLYMRYLGVLQLLGDASAYLPTNDDIRERIEAAMKDAEETYGLSVRKVFNRYDVSPADE